jgi:NADPH:quinone reductase-like Zn-dependent oxidoreductase
VNYPDVLILGDRYQFKPARPFSPGIEVSGTVVETGTEVRDFKPGDRVMGTLRWGGMAERALVARDECFHAPAGKDWTECAALLLTYSTTLHAFKDRGPLRAGDTLIVLGAAGGVGLSAVELGKRFGARVIAVASSEEKLTLARSRGADEGVLVEALLDLEQSRAFGQALKRASAPRGAQVVYDPVGGALAAPALRALAVGGRYLVIGFTGGIAQIPLNLPLLKELSIIGVFWGAFAQREPARHRENTQELLRWFAEDRIHPHVSECFPLERAGEAIARLEKREAQGKVVVQIDS